MLSCAEDDCVASCVEEDATDEDATAVDVGGAEVSRGDGCAVCNVSKFTEENGAPKVEEIGIALEDEANMGIEDDTGTGTLEESGARIDDDSMGIPELLTW